MYIEVFFNQYFFIAIWYGGDDAFIFTARFALRIVSFTVTALIYYVQGHKMPPIFVCDDLYKGFLIYFNILNVFLLCSSSAILASCP